MAQPNAATAAPAMAAMAPAETGAPVDAGPDNPSAVPNADVANGQSENVPGTEVLGIADSNSMFFFFFFFPSFFIGFFFLLFPLLYISFVYRHIYLHFLCRVDRVDRVDLAYVPHQMSAKSPPPAR